MENEIKPATAEQRAEWKRLANKATKGPWIKCSASNGKCSCGLIWSQSVDGVVAHVGISHEGEACNAKDYQHTNADFITVARTAVPALEAALVEAEEKLAESDHEKCWHVGCGLVLERDQLRAQVAALNDRCTALEQERDTERESAANAERRTTETRRDYDELSGRYEATVAKLGRTVAALRKHRVDITSVARFVRDMGDMPNTVAAVQDLLVDVDAVLADADSAAAGEAWARMVQLARDIFDADNMSEQPMRWGRQAGEALAKVDARRGGYDPTCGDCCKPIGQCTCLARRGATKSEVGYKCTCSVFCGGACR